MVAVWTVALGGGGVLHVLVVIQVFFVALDVLCAIGKIVQGGREVGRVVSVVPAVCVSDVSS